MKRITALRKLSKELLEIKFSLSTNKQAEYKRTIFNHFMDMGGVYVKFLQILAVNQDFMDGWAGPKEMEIFHKVPIEEMDAADFIDGTAFKSYSATPFAAGSFAQVYEGELLSGERVAIKVLRPSILKTLDGDLRFIKRLAKLLGSFLPVNIMMDYKDAAAEFCRNTKLETDYSREVANMKYFGDFYKNSQYVVVPKVYEELSDDKVIVQQYLDGPTFADILAIQDSARPVSEVSHALTGSNLWQQLTLAGGEFLRMAMVADWVFGDPHPGNIKLLSDGKIGLIDFGLIARRPTSQKTFHDWLKEFHYVLTGTKPKINDLLRSTLTCFCPDIAKAFSNCCLNGDESILDQIVNGVDEKLAHNLQHGNKTASSLLADGHLFVLFINVLGNDNAIDVRLDMANFQLLKATQSYLASVTMLDEREGGKHFAEVLKSALQYSIAQAEYTGVKYDVPAVVKYSHNESCEIVADTLSSLAAKDRFVFDYIFGRI
ncbi:MAG: AarF/ABC1/UbiB kinase family protein [Candidatus Nomurabacteria bacterium]|jgi:tRNA A-37 threonylcarbamoyl transferase component Bud32|nr:AarF/ABC1/UbiB kinase family protein [Candidatus Nomurabacteria bacterium]